MGLGFLVEGEEEYEDGGLFGDEEGDEEGEGEGG